MQWVSRSLLLVVLCGSGLAIPGPGLAEGNGELLPRTAADSLRTLQPEDLFRLHRLGDVRFSPGGERVAYELVRPGEEGAVQELPRLLDERSDIWLAKGAGGDPRPLTHGAEDGTGWFNPRWSPDGERLAFLSVNGNEVRPWIWERGEDEPRRLTERSVHLTSIGPLLFRWVSERELALAVRPQGASQRGRLVAEATRPGYPAIQAWEASWSGREVTVDVFEAGPGAEDEAHLSRSEVVILHVDGGSWTAASGRWGLAVPSPDGRWAATLSDPPVGEVDVDEPVRQKATHATRPGAVRLTGTGGDASQAEAAAESLDDPNPRTLRWAPDGSAYALLTRSSGGEGDASTTRLAVYRPQEAGLRLVGGVEKEIQGLAWTGDGELLVRAREVEEGSEPGPSHWWRPPREGGGEWEKWTAGMEAVPGDLTPVPGGAAGVADGDLWRLAHAQAERVLEPEGAAFRRLVGPAPPVSVGPAPPRRRGPEEPVRILAGSPNGAEVWTVRIDGHEAREITRLPAPEGAGTPADVAPTGDAAAFSTSDDTGTRLWRSRPGASEEAAADADTPEPPGALDTIVVRNQWLEEVDGAEARRLTYPAPDGDELTAWMLLPPGRPAETAHPTVVWIYPGTVHGERVPSLAGLNHHFGIGSLQLLAARGYAVLMPSVPMESGDEAARPELGGEVMPAVDRAVEEGLADPSRLGLMGHSYGGYGVNHLVSQTDRFQAAVSSASFAHLRSFYGTFDARARYGHMRHPLTQQFSTHGYFEVGQGGMGAPPTVAPERYREASPLTYVDEVSTPLMLIHGDQDFVPVQQAEMFFNELVRLGNRARLVRYAGEGHLVSGRANVLDMWERIFDWFDEFLGPPEGG